MAKVRWFNSIFHKLIWHVILLNIRVFSRTEGSKYGTNITSSLCDRQPPGPPCCFCSRRKIQFIITDIQRLHYVYILNTCGLQFVRPWIVPSMSKTIFFGHKSPQWAMASSFTRFLDHTQRRTTVGRTPLDEWSARRRDLYLTTRNTHNRQTCMSPGGIRTHSLSRRAAADLRLRPLGHWDLSLRSLTAENEMKLAS